ncbi:hypothetical protein GE061_004541 [Apolygus lucorum]|uniref:Glyoxalase domain-containing protein n=1 Tax=Apolygus lucorum TaxID=248454 RepID=A0A6A4IQP5_APOLU|nr:hypothetical protein GE061_004541 [Apolygus lucorum]
MSGLEIQTQHWRFIVGDRLKEVAFLKDVLGMKILRHEEFAKEVGHSTMLRTSKTFMGYGGPGFFKLELYFSYGVTEYERGNGFLGVTVVSKTAIARAKALNWPIEEVSDKVFRIDSPEGFTYYLLNHPTPTECDPIAEICLRSSYLTATIAYWPTNIGAKVLSEENDQVTFSFGEEKCKIRFVCWFGELVIHRNGCGCLTLSMPKRQLQILEYRSLENNRKHGYLHSIEEPGFVVSCDSLVFQDLDNHRVVIVEEEGYAPLVSLDPNATNAFDLSIQREQRRKEQKNTSSSDIDRSNRNKE